MDALEAINTRRSCRSFSNEPVDQEKLKEVIEAGRLAPSGGNSQTTRFIVIQNRELLDQLARLVQEEFAAMEVEEGMYRSIVRSIQRSKKGDYVFHFNTPVLVVLSNKKNYGNAMADSACTMENMMIAANALDLGSCWINQLHWLDENPAIRKVLEELGLQEDETITASLAIGNSDHLLHTPLPRTGNPVIWVD